MRGSGTRVWPVPALLCRCKHLSSPVCSGGSHCSSAFRLKLATSTSARYMVLSECGRQLVRCVVRTPGDFVGSVVVKSPRISLRFWQQATTSSRRLGVDGRVALTIEAHAPRPARGTILSPTNTPVVLQAATRDRPTRLVLAARTTPPGRESEAGPRGSRVSRDLVLVVERPAKSGAAQVTASRIVPLLEDQPERRRRTDTRWVSTRYWCGRPEGRIFRRARDGAHRPGARRFAGLRAAAQRRHLLCDAFKVLTERAGRRQPGVLLKCRTWRRRARTRSRPGGRDLVGPRVGVEVMSAEPATHAPAARDEARGKKEGVEVVARGEAVHEETTAAPSRTGEDGARDRPRAGRSSSPENTVSDCAAATTASSTRRAPPGELFNPCPGQRDSLCLEDGEEVAEVRREGVAPASAWRRAARQRCVARPGRPRRWGCRSRPSVQSSMRTRAPGLEGRISICPSSPEKHVLGRTSRRGPGADVDVQSPCERRDEARRVPASPTRLVSRAAEASSYVAPSISTRRSRQLGLERVADAPSPGPRIARLPLEDQHLRKLCIARSRPATRLGSRA